MPSTTTRTILLCLFSILFATCTPQPGPESVEAPTSAADNPPARRTATGTDLPTPGFQADPTPDGENILIGTTRFVRLVIPLNAMVVGAADFDNDGLLDLVSAAEPNLTIHRGDGNGGFDVISQVPGGPEPSELAISDLDSDGDLDIVVANHDTDYLTILLGDGQGTFQPAPNSPLKITVRPHPHVVRAEDFDGDGLVDLVVDDRDGEGLLILAGLGDGNFGVPGRFVDVGGDPYLGIGIGDLNGDGFLDLVTPNSDQAAVLLNTNPADFTFEISEPVAAETPFAVGLGDLNGDGWLDLITASDEGSARVQIFYGEGTGKFIEAAESPLEFSTGGKRIVIGDLNGDGIQDAVIASYHSPDVLVLLGGRGSHETGFLYGGKHPWAMALADFNQDDVDDLMIADDTGETAQLYLSLGP